MVFKGYCVLSSTFTLLHELVQLTSLCISCFICIVRMIAVPTIGLLWRLAELVVQNTLHYHNNDSKP